MHEQLKNMNKIVMDTKNLCFKLDTYQYKYLPVRIQSMIGDTLRACLKGDTRTKH
jgi:hypothetical protein